ncbi:MAG: ABC transporter ATP-binding protein [Acidobacteriota bacterium]
MATIDIRDLHIVYPGTTPGQAAVRGVDLILPSGQLTVIVGPSGCGKTSLLRAIAGFEMPHRGEVWIDDAKVAGPSHWVPPERRRVGMVFQDGALFPHLTVAENIAYGLARPRAAEAAARVDAMLDLAGLPRVYRDRYPDELSGGEQQRVALARALAPAPRAVLLDESFASLDASLRRQVRDDVRAILARAAVTGVLVTHDQEEALSLGDRVVVMHAGRVEQVGDPLTVYHRPASLRVARFLGDGQLLACRVDGPIARCALGEVSCVGPLARDGGTHPARTDGGDAGQMLVRPEDMDVRPRTHDAGSLGRICQRQFYGHDLIDEIELEDGARLAVRGFASACFPVGAQVKVILRPKMFQVFAAPARDAAPSVQPLRTAHV